MICSCGKDNQDCECKVDSENNSNFIWTSENDNHNHYDSIEEKFENSRISTKGITKYSSNEEAKNVSYELDISAKLRIDDIKNQRDRVNSDSDNSKSFQKRHQKSDKKTFESRYDLNLSLNAQLGEAAADNQGANGPISEEEEGINDDPDYFYMSTSGEVNQKDTFAFIKHTYSSGSENIDNVLEENDGIQEESNENVSHRNSEEDKAEGRASESSDPKSLKELKMNLKKIENQVREEIKQLSKENKKINILLIGPKGIGKTSFMKLFRVQQDRLQSSMGGQEKNNLRINFIDKPGYSGSQDDQHKWLNEILRFIAKKQLRYKRIQEIYNTKTDFEPFQKAVKVQSKDERIHLALYFIKPEVDFQKFDLYAMMKIKEKTNILPVIGKAESMNTPDLIE